jgi:hypothetical protein
MVWGCFGGGKSGRFIQSKWDVEEGRLSLHIAMPNPVDSTYKLQSQKSARM